MNCLQELQRPQPTDHKTPFNRLLWLLRLLDCCLIGQAASDQGHASDPWRSIHLGCFVMLTERLMGAKSRFTLQYMPPQRVS